MLLSELFNRLSLGVLSNLAIGGEGSGAIPAGLQAKLAMFVGNSLVALYSRFNLSEKEVVIRTSSSLTRYKFDKQFAVMNPTVGPKYILDTAKNVFSEDVLKILQIFDQDGLAVPMNDPGVEGSVFTPDHLSITVETPKNGNVYRLLYQASHTEISALVPVNLAQGIVLPRVLAAALEAHVAYQVFSAMNGQEHAAKALEQLGRYEMLCADVEQRDLVTTSLVQTHTKLDDRGFI